MSERIAVVVTDLHSNMAALNAALQRIDYDAEAVAAEMRRVGLPGELADKLPLAA